MLKVLSALALCLILVAPASADSVVIGTSNGASVLFGKGDEPTVLGAILVDAAYRFDYAARSEGEIALFYGANGVGTAEAGQVGGMSYRHLYDINQENNVKPGLSAGFFLAGADDIPQLEQTTFFLGGGGLLDITSDLGVIKAFAEYYISATEDRSGDRPGLLRFGANLALN